MRLFWKILFICSSQWKIYTIKKIRIVYHTLSTLLFPNIIYLAFLWINGKFVSLKPICCHFQDFHFMLKNLMTVIFHTVNNAVIRKFREFRMLQTIFQIIFKSIKSRGRSSDPCGTRMLYDSINGGLWLFTKQICFLLCK